MSRTFITDVTGVPASPPVSNAVVVGNTCHISGQLGMYDYRYCPASAGVEAAHAFDLVFKVYAASFNPYDVFLSILYFRTLNFIQARWLKFAARASRISRLERATKLRS